MAVITVSLKFLLKLILMIFVPVLFIVSFVWIKLSNYSKKNENNVNRVYYLHFYSYITSIIITLSLLIINTSFSVYFANIIKSKDLIVGNETIYYCILGSPAISLIAVIYYIICLVKLIIKGKYKEEIYLEIL